LFFCKNPSFTWVFKKCIRVRGFYQFFLSRLTTSGMHIRRRNLCLADGSAHSFVVDVFCGYVGASDLIEHWNRKNYTNDHTNHSNCNSMSKCCLILLQLPQVFGSTPVFSASAQQGYPLVTMAGEYRGF
jgi:hypothetical protein